MGNWEVTTETRWPLGYDFRWFKEVDIKEHKVTLSSAQILNLHDTAVPITPTPGATQYVVPIAMRLKHLFGTTAYVGGDFLLVTTIPDFFGPLGGASMYAEFDLLLAGYEESTLMTDAFLAQDQVSVEGSVGVPLVLVTQGTAFTDGDGTLEVTTLYTLQT